MSHRAELAGALRLVVAHSAEARPIIDHFDLQRRPNSGPLRVYERGALALVVSGLGKVSAAMAVAHLDALAPGQGAWLNVGVAGHRDQPLGSTHLVRKVVDRASGECWYPQRNFAAPCAGADLVTVDRPETEYREDALYDMEGSGFCAAAARYATFELVHLLKVVSDNADNPIVDFEPRRAAGHIENALAVVERLVGELSALSAEVSAWRAPPPLWEVFVERWHFTASQRVQLQRLLQRWSILRGETPAIQVARDARSSRGVLARLRAGLDGAHPDFGISHAESPRERAAPTRDAS